MKDIDFGCEKQPEKGSCKGRCPACRGNVDGKEVVRIDVPAEAESVHPYERSEKENRVHLLQCL